MEARSPLEVVYAYQEAWITRDFEAAARCIADDIVFQSPQQHIETASPFMQMITSFAQRIAPHWASLGTTVDGDNVLLLYNLFTLDGRAAPCADFFVVEAGMIKRDTLVFDPKPFLAA